MKKRAKKKSKKNSKNSKKTIAAFFDVDGTIIKETSDTFILKELIKRKKIGIKYVIRFFYYVLLHKLNLLDIDKAKKFLGFLKGLKPKKEEHIAKIAFERDIKKRIPEVIKKTIKEHKQKKHKIVLISNSPKILLKHFKKYLKADLLVCSELEVKNNKFTGKLGKICYGKYKIKLIKGLTKNIDLKKSYVYSDSYSDMPLFNLVGNKIAVNPDLKLKKHAKEHNWEIIEY